jgi:hypothetical protein
MNDGNYQGCVVCGLGKQAGLGGMKNDWTSARPCASLAA